MPLINYQIQPIRVDIPDAVIGGTVVKRKALLIRMNQTLLNDSAPIYFGGGNVGVELNLVIEHYAVGPNDANGQATYGERLNTRFPGIDYPYAITGNSNSIVDAATGQKLCDASEYQQVVSMRQQNPELDIKFPATLYNADGTEKNFMTEDQFFSQLADNVPVVVSDMEKQYIQQTAAMGKF